MLVLQHSDCQFLVITGRDKSQYEDLKDIEMPDSVSLLGWTDQMAELIKLSTLVLTKAGGSTIMECIAAHKPIVINKIIPGQEEGNAELIKRYRLGIVAQTPSRISQAITTILNDYPAYQNRLARAAQPDAAHEILVFLRARLDSKNS